MLDQQNPDLISSEAANGTQALPENGSPANLNRHAEAGRKGAHRVHQLIQEGKLYEQEHGLKRGRQRLRQLIEEGKLYEEEHGLRVRRKRRTRQSSDQLVRSLLQVLLRLAKPRFRSELVRVLQAMEADAVP